MPLLQAQPSTTGKEAFAPGSFGLDPFSVPSVQDGEVQDLRAAYQNEVEGQVGHQATVVNVSCMSPDLLMTLCELHKCSAMVLAESTTPQDRAWSQSCKTSFHSLQNQDIAWLMSAVCLCCFFLSQLLRSIASIMALQAAFDYHMTGTQELLPDHLDEPIPLPTWEASLQTSHNSVTDSTNKHQHCDGCCILFEHTAACHADEV